MSNRSKFVVVGTDLRDAGYKVEFMRGWDKASNGYALNVKGMVNHHTASSNSASASAVNTLLRRGRAGRYPLSGPLCNFAVGRDGTIYVIAIGAANHAGPGGFGGVQGNSRMLGNEVHYDGVSPMSSAQADATVALNYFAMRAFGYKDKMICEHKDWTTRKSDRYGVTREGFVGQVRAFKIGSFILGTRMLGLGSYGDDVEALQRELNRNFGMQLEIDKDYGPNTAKAVARMQELVKAKPDGVYGPLTHAARIKYVKDRAVIIESALTDAVVKAEADKKAEAKLLEALPPPLDWRVAVTSGPGLDEGVARVYANFNQLVYLHPYELDNLTVGHVVQVGKPVGYQDGPTSQMTGANRVITVELATEAIRRGYRSMYLPY